MWRRYATRASRRQPPASRLVRRICGKYKMDCGFGGKSTKIGIVDAKEVLSDFRYSAKLNVPLVSIK